MTLIASILIFLANLAVLAMNLKLYTEILKDQSMSKRLLKKETTNHPTP